MSEDEGAFETWIVETNKDLLAQLAKTFGPHHGACSKASVPPREVQELEKLQRFVKFVEVFKNLVKFVENLGTFVKKLQDSLYSAKIR